jgi:hypothetical protein
MAYFDSARRSLACAAMLLSLLVLLVGCRDGDGDAERAAEQGATAKEPPQADQGPWPLDEVPDELRPRVERGMQAMDAVQANLFQALSSALAAGAPSEALEVCSELAQPLTAEVAAQAEVEVGRTSLKLRNPKNEPLPWVRAWLEAHWDEPAAGVMPIVVDLGDALGIARPIGTMDLCETCHGPEDALSADLRASLERLYPEDQAVGFTAGDMRGAFWAKVADNSGARGP